jgi:hypothetical protein
MARTEVRGGQILDASVSLTADVTGTLPVGNGGTGVSTLTGLVKGGGTSAMTAVAAPSGVVVGDTDTQTLTNKTIDGNTNTLAGGALMPCRVLADTAPTFTIAAGTVTQISGTSVGGVTVAVGDRICIHCAPASTGTGSWASLNPGNGIYVVTANTTNITVARAADMTGTVKPAGKSAMILDGNDAGTLMYVDNPRSPTAAFTYGSTAMYWARASSSSFVDTWNSQTLTNKRVVPRTGTATSSATPTINTDNVDFYSLTAQAADITSFTTNLSGTPTDGQKLWIAITGTAARAITWGASFEASTVALPTTTVGTNRLDVGFVWNSASSRWRCVATC